MSDKDDKGSKGNKEKNATLKMFNQKIAAGLILLFMFMVAFSINRKSADKHKELTILCEGNSIVFEVKPVVDIMQDKELFISVQDVKNLFDKNLHEDDIEIISTHEDSIAYINKSENKLKINDSDTLIDNVMRQTAQGKLISLTKMQDVYGIKIEYDEKTKTIMINSVAKNGTTNDNESDDKSDNKSDDKSDNKSDNKSDDKSNNKDSKLEVKLYNNYNNISGVYNDLEVDESKFNIVSPKMLFVGKKKDVKDETNHSSAAYSIYESWANRNKLTIVPRVVTEEKEDVFETYSQREGIATALITCLKRYQYEGLCLDIKEIKNTYTFKRFIIELSPRMKKENKRFVWIYNRDINKDDVKEFVDDIVEE